MSTRVTLTTSRLTALTCRPGQQQVLLWDAKVQGLGVRATQAGAKSWVFQYEFGGKTVRMTLGAIDAMRLSDARQQAEKHRDSVNQGRDPRVLKQEAVESDAAKLAAAAERAATLRLKAVPASEAWTDYLAARKPVWGQRHYADHLSLSRAGGIPAAGNWKQDYRTKPGPLASLLQLPLAALDGPTVTVWAQSEVLVRPTSARLALRLLRAFLGWCAEQPCYAGLLSADSAARIVSKPAREALGQAMPKNDYLERSQLKSWFEQVRTLPNELISAYLQTLLLTGARPGEVRALKWSDTDTQWQSLTIRDKVEGERQIPLTPYVAQLLAGLPRRNNYVFGSTGSKSEYITEPTKVHTEACMRAQLGGLTLHGLRRSFASLTEWLEIPVGIVAQIQGHKPSATAEKHYRRRPLDLLRLHHERIEKWILEQASVWNIDAPEVTQQSTRISRNLPQSQD
jgi:integrase